MSVEGSNSKVGGVVGQSPESTQGSAAAPPPLPPSSSGPLQPPHQFPIVSPSGVPAFISTGQIQPPFGMNNTSGIPMPGMLAPYPLVIGGPGGAGVPLNAGQFVPGNPSMIPGAGPYFNAGGLARAPIPGAAPAMFSSMYPIPNGQGAIVPGVPPFGQHHSLGGGPPRMGNPMAAGGMHPGGGPPPHHSQGNMPVQQRMNGPPQQGGAPRPPSSHLQHVNVSNNASGTPPTSSAGASSTPSQRPPATTEANDVSKAVGDAFKDAVLKRMAEKKGNAPTVTVTDPSKAPSSATVPTSEPASAPNPSQAHVPIAHVSHAVPSSPHTAHSGHHVSTHASTVAPPTVPGYSPSHLTHAPLVTTSAQHTQPRPNVSQHATHAPVSQSTEHHSDSHRPQTAPSAFQISSSQPAGADLLAALRRADDDDEPAPSSPAPDRFMLARTGGKVGSVMTEMDRLELLERLRVEYAAKHHRAKLSYTLDALRNIKENIRHELTSASFPPGMKAHKLLPTGGRKVAVEDDPIAKAKKFFTSILNKLSRDNFNKLVVDLVKYDIKSQEMLTAIISTVFDKALEDVKYQDIYADLCKLLGERAQEWSQKYLRVMELDEKQAPAGAGWYFDVSGGSTVQDGEWQGPLTTRDEAQDKGYRISNFKRLLLNRCQLEFFREDLLQTGQEEELDEAQKAARGGSMTAAEIEEFRVRALRRKELRRANKKRMLSNMAFIGQLYMAGMLTSPILFSCCGKLLNAGKPITTVPDPDDIEALCKLLTLAGGKLEEEEKHKLKEKPDAEMKMVKTFELLQLTIDAHPKLESRSRFLVKDLIDLRSNKWELTGSASTIERQARTVTLAQAKALILAEEEAEKAKLMSSSGDSGPKGSYSNAGLGNSARQQVSRSGGGVSGNNGGGRNDQGNNAGQDYRNQQRRTGPASTLGQRGKGPVSSSSSGGAESSSSEDGWATVPVKGGKVLPPSSQSSTSIQSPPSTPSGATGEAPSSPAVAPAALSIKTVVLSGDALLKHVSTIVLEFCRIMDADELIRSVTEVSGSVNYQKILVQGALIDAVKSADARKNAGKAIVTLASKGLMQRESIVSGLATFMMSYSDLVSDAPKIFEYTALVSIYPRHSFCAASDDRHILTPLVRVLRVYEHNSCLNCLTQ